MLNYMSLDPKIWGPPMWTTLVIVALGYPKTPTIDDAYHYKRWYYHLQFTIPCEVCRKNFAIHVRQIPIDNFLKSRKSLLFWVTQIHNLVGDQQGKAPLSVHDMVSRYVKTPQQTPDQLIEGFGVVGELGGANLSPWLMGGVIVLIAYWAFSRMKH